jgi:hypothetical protein
MLAAPNQRSQLDDAASHRLQCGRPFRAGFPARRCRETQRMLHHKPTVRQRRGVSVAPVREGRAVQPIVDRHHFPDARVTSTLAIWLVRSIDR